MVTGALTVTPAPRRSGAKEEAPLSHTGRVPSVVVRHSPRRCRPHSVRPEVAFAPRDQNGRPASGPQRLLDPHHAGLSPHGCDRKASGPVVDAETGFQYLRARYYDPATGQFLSRDPITALTQEPYGYTGGNPVNNTDPIGLCSINPFSNESCLNSAAKAVTKVQLAVIDVVAVFPYSAYDGSYHALKAINSFGDQFGPVGTVASRVFGAPLLIPKATGLGTDIGIDWVKGEDWADESKNQCDKRSINPLHSQGFVPSFLRGGPKWYLPGAYRDPQGDPHVNWEW